MSISSTLGAVVAQAAPAAGGESALMGMLPSPLLTADQVESLKTDTTVSNDALTLKDLGIMPTGLDVILPTYLSRYRPGGRFGDKKRA